METTAEVKRPSHHSVSGTRDSTGLPGDADLDHLVKVVFPGFCYNFLFVCSKRVRNSSQAASFKYMRYLKIMRLVKDINSNSVWQQLAGIG